MLHLNEKWLNTIVDRVAELKPDIIALTGDLVEGEYAEISLMLKPLSKLTQVPHKYFTTGNHEYINGSGPWEECVAGMGFRSLHNENEIIQLKGARIMMAGVPDRMIKRFIKNKKSLPDVALKSSEKVDYKILLAHQAKTIKDMKTETCDLMLTGHTHGGQLFPFHYFVRLVQPVLTGFAKIKGVLIFVHQGTGFWGPPMRWFSRSEIVVFDWE
jgi:predicted MPP superfamily phosphohydrolase